MSNDTANAEGVLLGLAAGDALGRPVEFKSPNQIRRGHGRLSEMKGHGTHGKPAGTITDDTDLALCIARSLDEHEDFVPKDIAERFIDWREAGPFDIGIMTGSSIDALRRGASPWMAGKQVWKTRSEGRNAGNGSVMRTAPYGVAYSGNEDSIVKASTQDSRMTHYDKRCRYSCAILNLTISNFLEHDYSDPSTALDDALDTLETTDHIPKDVEEAVANIPHRQNESELSNAGYSVATLQAGLYHALSSDTAEEAIVNGVNMGGDTDTIGAVTGALAGARFGIEAIPDRWVVEIDEEQELRSLAQSLWTTDFPTVERVR